MSDEEFNRLLADRKFLNSIARRLAWTMFKLLLPFAVVGALVEMLIQWAWSALR